MQEQAIKAAKAGDDLAQQLITIIRKIGIVTNHITATGLAVALTTVKAEYDAYAAWDKTGTVPQVNGNDVAAINPQFIPEFVTEYSPEIDSETGQPVVVDGVQQYTELSVRNRQFRGNIPQYVFSSSTGLSIDGDGVLTGTSHDIDDLILMIGVAAQLNTFVTANNNEVLAKIESVSTV